MSIQNLIEYSRSGNNPNNIDINASNVDLKDTTTGMTPLMNACDADNFHMVNFLISKGASVNETDANGISPLMYASKNCTQNALNIIQALVLNGANLNYNSANFGSALTIATNYKCTDNVNLLNLYISIKGGKGKRKTTRRKQIKKRKTRRSKK